MHRCTSNSTALFTSAAATADPPELVSTAISAPVSLTVGDGGAAAHAATSSPPAATQATTLADPPRPTRLTSVLNQLTVIPILPAKKRAPPGVHRFRVQPQHAQNERDWCRRARRTAGPGRRRRQIAKQGQSMRPVGELGANGARPRLPLSDVVPAAGAVGLADSKDSSAVGAVVAVPVRADRIIESRTEALKYCPR